MALNEGDAIPDVAVTLADGSVRQLGETGGKPIVIYFYPKDDTSGCTSEAKDFSTALGDFSAAGVEVLGISKDPPEKHRKFAAKHSLSVPLATDADERVCEAFGVWVEKSMYGKTYLGIERATFLFDAHGRLARVWRKVRVPGHVEQVLEAARAL
jgi:thioredoxin-dependent peroxiredoxin